MEKIQPLPPQSSSLMEEAVSSTRLQQCVMGTTREGKMLLAYRGQGRKSLIVEEGVCVCVCVRRSGKASQRRCHRIPDRTFVGKDFWWRAEHR